MPEGGGSCALAAKCLKYGGDDEALGIGDRGLNGGAEGLAEFGGAGADGEEQGSARDAAVEVQSEGEEFRCAGVVGG